MRCYLRVERSEELIVLVVCIFEVKRDLVRSREMSLCMEFFLDEVRCVYMIFVYCSSLVW